MLHRFDCAKFTMRIWRRAQREWLFNPRSNRRRTSSPSPEKGSERTNSGARHRSPAGAGGGEGADDPGVWRTPQPGPIRSIFFWGTALAGIFWPILGQRDPPGPMWWFVRDVLGVGEDRATLVGILLLFLAFVTLILSFV